jgi:hypothetical protein
MHSSHRIEENFLDTGMENLVAYHNILSQSWKFEF